MLISDARTTSSTSRSEVSAPCAHARRGTLPVRGIDCHWPLALHACSGVNACARRTRQGPMAPRVALVVRVKIKEIRCDKVQSPKNFRPAGASQRGVRFVDTSKSASGRVTPTGKTAHRMFPLQKKRDLGPHHVVPDVFISSSCGMQIEKRAGSRPIASAGPGDVLCAGDPSTALLLRSSS